MKINNLLKMVKMDIKNLKKNKRKQKITEKIPKNTVDILKGIRKNMDFYRLEFCIDTIFGKNIKAILYEPMYYKKMKKYEEKIERNKNKNIQSNMEFEIYEGISEDLSKINEIFDAVLEGLDCIINDIEDENYLCLELSASMGILISRIGKLYDFYGDFLKDMKCTSIFELNRPFFDIVDYIFDEELYQKLKKK